MAYKLQYGDRVKRLSDGRIFPTEGPTADTQQYLAWVALGNTPEPADPVPLEYANQTKSVLKSQLNDALVSGNQAEINAATAALLNAL